MAQCPPASTPYSGTEAFFVRQNGITTRGVLGDIANYILGFVPSPNALGVSICNTYASCSGQTATGSVTAGSTALSLASLIDFGTVSPCTTGGGNYCGITVAGAGPTVAVGTPGSFSADKLCSTITVTGDTVSGKRLVKNVSLLAGIYAGNGITGTGIPASTTITTSAYNPSTFRLSANATATNTGVTFTIADPCNVPYQYKIAAIDAAGGISTVSAAATVTGPLHLSTFNNNCLTWTRPGGSVPVGYAIWRSLDSGATWKFWQVSHTEGTGACGLASAPGPDLDLGQKTQARPWWIPDTPPSVAQNDWLRTTVVSGAGKIGMTLGTPASNTVSGATVLHDDTPGWLAWTTLLNTTGAEGLIPANTINAQPTTVIRVARAANITSSNVRITGQRGATLAPFGGGLVVGPLTFQGGNVGAPTYALTQTFPEGSGCLPLSGLTPGQTALITEGSPGGPSQSIAYTMISPVSSGTCENNYTRLADATPISLNQSTVATISGSISAGNTVSLTANAVVNNGAVSSATTVTYTEIGGDTTTTTAAGLAAAVNANATLTNVGIAAYASGATVILSNESGAAVNWQASASGTTNTLTGPAGAIVAGTVTAGDTVTMTATGDLSCAGTYTVLSGDTAGLAARGLALAIVDQCGLSGVFASSTINLLKITTPATAAVTWTPSTTGGHTTLTAANGTGAVAHTIAPISNVGVRSLMIDGTDMVPSALNTSAIGLFTYDTSLSEFGDLYFKNFGNGTGLFAEFDYSSIFSDIQLFNASGGVPNVLSYSDFWILGCTKTQVANIQAISGNSFGSQIAGCMSPQVSQFAQRGAAAGRGFKLGGVAGGAFANIESSQNVFDGVVICCGTSKNQFTNIAALDNGIGLNYSGIAMFDAYDQFNTFTNVRAIGQPFDISNGASDLYNLWSNVIPGTNNLGGTGFYPDISNPALNTFLGLPNCGVAGLNNNGPQCLNFTGSSTGVWNSNVGATVAAPFTLNSLPTSCAGKPAGTVWNNSGVLNLC